MCNHVISRPSVRTLLAAAITTLTMSAAFAAPQPINPVNGVITADTSALASFGATLTPLGAATYAAATGMLTLPVASATTAVNPGPLTVNFGAADGFSLAAPAGTFNFSNFVFDVGTKSLIGDVGNGGFFNFQDGAILVAANVIGTLGSDPVGSVSTSALSRNLYLKATTFTLAPAFSAYITGLGLNASAFSSVGSAVTQLEVGAVPEPSTYGLMLAGLGVAALARRRQRAA